MEGVDPNAAAMLVVCLGALAASAYARTSVKRKAPESKRTSALTGAMWVAELLDGHDGRFFEQFRMNKAAFLALVAILQLSGLQDYKSVLVTEQVAIFLQLVAHSSSSTQLCERFQRSGSTINLYVHILTCRLTCRLPLCDFRPSPGGCVLPVCAPTG
jgi:hypothetical protein